ncbi:MAG TPA: hypothetical protein VJJ82_01035 [Candidatus Nanoarchaeia archaeon]|nr:hypothetical protein [Candidatus Nanoarchaeia archaeon]
MAENHAIIGILLIVVIAAASYVVLYGGSTGAAVSTKYVTCCCNAISGNGQMFVRSQVQTFADNCQEACSNRMKGKVFAQTGLCAENP